MKTTLRLSIPEELLCSLYSEYIRKSYRAHDDAGQPRDMRICWLRVCT